MAQTYKIKFIFGDAEGAPFGRAFVITSNKTCQEIEDAIEAFGNRVGVKLDEIENERNDDYVSCYDIGKIIDYVGDTPLGEAIMRTMGREKIPDEITTPSAVVAYAREHALQCSFSHRTVEQFFVFMMLCVRVILSDFEWDLVTQEYDGTISGYGWSFFY
jgi:hypothetical protein